MNVKLNSIHHNFELVKTQKLNVRCNYCIKQIYTDGQKKRITVNVWEFCSYKNCEQKGKLPETVCKTKDEKHIVHAQYF